jgi:hypothetical protein
MSFVAAKLPSDPQKNVENITESIFVSLQSRNFTALS